MVIIKLREDFIKLGQALKAAGLVESGVDAKFVVGGAVLTPEYAQMIGADKYAKDAMETVRYAQEIFK